MRDGVIARQPGGRDRWRTHILITCVGNEETGQRVGSMVDARVEAAAGDLVAVIRR
jgi:hypothetical protein